MMKKVYRNKLPKDMEVDNTNIHIENGELIIDVEFKEKLNPKDGDFLVSQRGGIFIYSNEKAAISGVYSSYCGEYGGCISLIFSDNWTKKGGCRYATTKEKEAFLKRLEKEYNKKWNAEKKCLEDIFPKFGDIVKVICPDEFRGYMICIFPNKRIPLLSYKEDFYDIANLNKEGNLTFSCAYNSDRKIVPASDSEKKELFDKLEKDGKRWNPVTKQIETDRWIPAEEEIFYFINWNGKVYQERNCGKTSKLKILANNCFKTEEAALPHAEKIKEIFKNSKAY